MACLRPAQRRILLFLMVSHLVLFTGSCTNMLNYEVEFGDLDTVEERIAMGDDVNAADFWGDTALATAIMAGKQEKVELLLDSGARVNVRAGMSSPLVIAVAQGNTAIVALLLDAGADVNSSVPTEYHTERWTI